MNDVIDIPISFFMGMMGFSVLSGVIIGVLSAELVRWIRGE